MTAHDPSEGWRAITNDPTWPEAIDYTKDHVFALADAMGQLLDDMGTGGKCVCSLAKAKARVAYEPFRLLMEDDGVGIMSMHEAEQIIEEYDG